MKTKCESQRTPVGLREESPFPTIGEIKDWIRSGLIERPNSRKEKYSTRAGLVDKDQTEAYWDDKTFSCGMGSSGQRTLKILNSKVLFNFGGCRGGPHISPPPYSSLKTLQKPLSCKIIYVLLNYNPWALIVITIQYAKPPLSVSF